MKEMKVWTKVYVLFNRKLGAWDKITESMFWDIKEGFFAWRTYHKCWWILWRTEKDSVNVIESDDGNYFIDKKTALDEMASRNRHVSDEMSVLYTKFSKAIKDIDRLKERSWQTFYN